MRLPNAEQACVDRAKVVDYLLSTEHEKGRDKAEFFLRFGFSEERWEDLADALRVHGASHEAVMEREDEFGVRYSVDGMLESPDKRNPGVKSVWMIDKGSSNPRLISAYPARRRDETQGA